MKENVYIWWVIVQDLESERRTQGMRKYKFKHMARKAVAIALAAAVAVTGVPGFSGGGTKAEAAEMNLTNNTLKIRSISVYLNMTLLL